MKSSEASRSMMESSRPFRDKYGDLTIGVAAQSGLMPQLQIKVPTLRRWGKKDGSSGLTSTSSNPLGIWRRLATCPTGT